MNRYSFNFFKVFINLLTNCLTRQWQLSRKLKFKCCKAQHVFQSQSTEKTTEEFTECNFHFWRIQHFKLHFTMLFPILCCRVFIENIGQIYGKIKLQAQKIKKYFKTTSLHHYYSFSCIKFSGYQLNLMTQFSALPFIIIIVQFYVSERML